MRQASKFPREKTPFFAPIFRPNFANKCECVIRSLFFNKMLGVNTANGGSGRCKNVILLFVTLLFFGVFEMN